MQLRHPSYRIGWSATVLGLCGLATCALADEGGCVLDASVALPELARASQPGSGHPSWQLLLIEELAADALSFECDGDRLTQLKLIVAPGASRSLMLLAETGVSMNLIREAGARGTLTLGHWTAELQAFAVNNTGELLPWDNSPSPDELVQLVQLRVAISQSVPVGQRHEWVLFPATSAAEEDSALRLTLESGPEERLFRDDFHFQIDPTLSQFSLRTPALRPNPYAFAPDDAGASL